MRKSLVVLSIVAMVALFSAASFAATPQVVLAYDDNPAGNSATAFTLNPANGTLTLFKKLATTGTGLGGSYFAATSTSIASNAQCVFVADTGSDDIASFAAPSYAQTGSLSVPGAFSTFGTGGSLALHPSGQLLASGNSGTENVSVYKVGANCTLTLIASYVPNGGADLVSMLAFTPDGKGLIVPLPDFESVEYYSVNTSNGTLTDVNNFVYTNISACSVGCFPTGIDITNDSKVAVFGNASFTSSVLTANISSTTGLSNGQLWSVNNTLGAGNAESVWFNAGGAAGNGELYVGMSGGGGLGDLKGETTMKFTESPLNLTTEGTGNLIATYGVFVGGVRSFGNVMVVAEYPAFLQTFAIGAGNGVITPGPITTDSNAASLLSIEVFPRSR
jgi:hypothetical protein